MRWEVCYQFNDVFSLPGCAVAAKQSHESPAGEIPRGATTAATAASQICQSGPCTGGPRAAAMAAVSTTSSPATVPEDSVETPAATGSDPVTAAVRPETSSSPAAADTAGRRSRDTGWSKVIKKISGILSRNYVTVRCGAHLRGER